MVLKRQADQELYKMPDCLKELVDYKKSQDYLMFKQLHKQLNLKGSNQAVSNPYSQQSCLSGNASQQRDVLSHRNCSS